VNHDRPEDKNEMSKVAIVGCGLVGTAWSIVYARAGHDVRLFDAKPDAAEAARKSVADSLPALADQGLLNGKRPADVLARLTPAASLAEAVGDADYVQESAPERLEIKRPLYQEIDKLVSPHAVIGSSTSGFPASSFTADLKCRARCMVVHPLNPPHLIAAVELVPAPWTAPETFAFAEKLMRAVGQSPIKLTREINGFVVNRLQSAVLAEAFRLIDDNVCGVADVDAAMTEGLGMRWFFIGPFETIDLNAPEGVAGYCQKLGPMYEGLAREQADVRPWSEALVKKIDAQRRAMVASGSLAERRSWRDKCLAAFVTAKRSVIAKFGA
jgi:L-gulonate 3-dehydrogenase